MKQDTRWTWVRQKLKDQVPYGMRKGWTVNDLHKDWWITAKQDDPYGYLSDWDAVKTICDDLIGEYAS